MLRVGVLRGGTGNHYDESLATGGFVLQNLSRDEYEPIDIFLDSEGVWHMGGKPLSYEKLAMRVDVIWNALHGFYGEDGKVQQLLENLGIPYTGSGPLSSAVAMNKKLSEDMLAKLGIKTPRGVYIEDWGSGAREETVASVVRTVSEKFSPPWIVEPISRGRTNGGSRSLTRDELTATLLKMFDLEIPVLVEEAVLGREASVIASSGFRGQQTYTFLPTQNGTARTKMKKGESEQLQKLAGEVHRGLGLGPYSRTHVVITPKGAMYVRGVETMPAFHDASDLLHVLGEVGVSFPEFAEHLIEEALSRK